MLTFIKGSAALGLMLSGSVMAHEFSCPAPDALTFSRYQHDGKDRWMAKSLDYPESFPDILKGADYELMAPPAYPTDSLTDSLTDTVRVTGISFVAAMYSRKSTLDYKCIYRFRSDEGKDAAIILNLGAFSLPTHSPLMVIPYGEAWKWDEKSDNRKPYYCVESREKCQFKIPKVSFSHSVYKTDSLNRMPEFQMGLRWDDEERDNPFERIKWFSQLSANETRKVYNHIDKIPDNDLFKITSASLVYKKPKEDDSQQYFYSYLQANGWASVNNKICDVTTHLSRCDCSGINLFKTLTAPGHTQIFIEHKYNAKTDRTDFQCDLLYIAGKSYRQRRDAAHSAGHTDL